MFKEYIISRHCTKKRGNYGNNLSPVQLNRKLARQQNIYVKENLAQEASTLVSFMIAYNMPNIANHGDDALNKHAQCG